MNDKEHPLKKYTRSHVKRTTTCPGCGIGIVAQAILRAIDELGLDMDDCAFVSGIGCSAWIPSPLFDADTLHTTHGRPIAFANGNHLIHAARRNINLTVVLVNNGIYGMTGGQTAPTTPRGLRTITSPYGTMEHPFDLAPMVMSAGAPYVARWTTCHPRQLTRSIKAGLQKKGFAFVEALSQCPVQFGRVSKLGKAAAMMQHFKDNSVNIRNAGKMAPEELQGKYIVGEFANVEKEELSQQWTDLKCKMMEEL